MLCLGHKPNPLLFVTPHHLQLSPAAVQWQMIPKRESFGGRLSWFCDGDKDDEDSGPRSSAESAAGKSRGILLMLEGEIR